ncbi:FTR1 family protein [Staphylococcus sp. SQ8-PEA]|uniref:FTR1 family protein n=1 Tax=Staphylococcus marylandisciuri TaxID=2981529 RepID=A0ABT2QMR5_9STAP|nr:FTR1 family protein [Staphylococcus marylandisciuri]MCU5745266.1 FTR1 family protein [Staphylococcus marylandisciuri]
MIALLMITLTLSIPSTTSAKDLEISDVYAAITDSKMTLDDSKASQHSKEQAVEDVVTKVNRLRVKDSKEGREVNDILKKLESSHNVETQKEQLSDLTKALIAYEKSENKSDDSGEIKTLKSSIKAKDPDFQNAIQAKDQEKLKALNNEVNSIWTKHESIIRNKDVGQYGQIEVGLMQLRVAVEKEPLNTKKVNSAWTNFSASIQQAGQQPSEQESSKYNAGQLNEALNTAIQAIDNNNLDKADTALTQFIKTWPYVEGEIQTKNISLYTKIENKVPYYQGILDQHNKEDVKKGLSEINQEIKDTVNVDHYSSIDVMLIFLREGLEVLLIIMTLTTMTKKMDDRKGTRSIVGGAIIGGLLSLSIALLFIHIFGEAGTLREGIEAGLGIIAVALMFVVGLWLHRRSSAKRWDAMVESMYQSAVRQNSVLLLGIIGLITVLREGVEVIVFYVGMLGNISTLQFVLGILYAVIILIIFAVLYRYIVRLIPLHYIFKVLTFVLFIMAFKMLGVSVQKLQLLHIIGRHDIASLPTISWIGFYPTAETILAQAILVIAIATYLIINGRRGSK